MRGAILLAALFFAAPAAAQDGLADARASGVIGEKSNGYVAILSAEASDALRRKVADVNIRRRALYAQLAVKRGVQPSEVGMVATCSFFPKLPAGSLYQWADGEWRRVGPDGITTLASYCD